MINNYKKSSLSIFLIFLNILNFIDVKFFMLLFFVFLCIYIDLDFQYQSFDKFLFVSLPVTYYMNSFLKTFIYNPSSSIFWDMQNFLHYLRCNVEEFEYNYMFLNEILSCPESIGYGPLTELLFLPTKNIWFLTLLIAALFILFIIFFVIKLPNYMFPLIVILISPGFHFLFFSLNSDIFVLFFLAYLLKKENFQSNLNFNLLLLSFITLIKTYPLLIFVGFGILFLLKKDFKSFTIACGYFIVCTIVLFQHYIINSSLLPDPLSYTRSFGLLHDLKLLNIFIELKFSILIAMISSFILFFSRNQLNKLLQLEMNKLENINIEKFILISPMIFFINIYQNWGYKFIFNSLILLMFYNALTNKSKLILLFLNLISTTYYLIGWGYENTITNFIIFIISKVSFYIYFYLLFVVFLKFILQEYKLYSNKQG